MEKMTQLTPPLKWHGGKSYLASKLWAIAKRVPHVHRVEPYFGGGSFTLATEPEGYSEVVNDLNGDLINFWNVLKNDSTFEAFQRIIQCTPFSEEAWKSAGDDRTYSPPVWRAWAFFVRCRQS